MVHVLFQPADHGLRPCPVAPMAPLEHYLVSLKCTVYLISKLDLCEGGSFSRTIFTSDIVSPIRVLYLFVQLSLCRRQRMPKIRTLVCLVDILKKRSFLI